MTTCKRFLAPILGILLLWGGGLQGQNLIPNSGFDVITFCPPTISLLQLAPPWVSPAAGTPDLFNACNSSQVGVPANQLGFENALSGDGYAGVVTYSGVTAERREYLQVELTSPLLPGLVEVSFSISRGDSVAFATDGLGAYLSDTAVSATNWEALPFVPQVKVPDGTAIVQDSGWMRLTDTILVNGGERFLTIGNFFPDSLTEVDSVNLNLNRIAYYYVDQASCRPVGTPPDLSVDGTACLGDTAVLTATGGNGNYQWFLLNGGWSLVGNGPVLEWLADATYNFAVVSGSDTAYHSLVPWPLPESLLPEDTLICPGECIDLLAVGPGLTAYWEGRPQSENPFQVCTPGTYGVLLVDSLGCESRDTIDVIEAQPFEIDLGQDTSVCEGTWVLDASHPQATSYLWSTGTTGPFLEISEPGTYWVQASSRCFTSRDTILVIPIGDPEGYFVPNVVTPNGDQINDCFRVQTGIPQNFFRLSVYDRWGRLLWISDQPEACWDGTYRQKPVPEGAYYWVLEAFDCRSEIVVTVGFLTLLR